MSRFIFSNPKLRSLFLRVISKDSAQLFSLHSEVLFLHSGMRLNYLLLCLLRIVWELTRINERKIVAVCMLSMHLAILRLWLKLCLGVVLRTSAWIATAKLLNCRCRRWGWRDELIGAWTCWLWYIFVAWHTFLKNSVIVAHSWTVCVRSEFLLWVGSM